MGKHLPNSITKARVTAELVREVFQYDADAGVLIRNSDRKIAGSVNGEGYVILRFLGAVLRAHRVIWLHVHGRWPTGGIDHINGNPADNRISNLREATPSQNMGNRKGRKSRKHALPKGVTLQRSGKFAASFRMKRLGVFDTPESAHAVYAAAARAHFGEFARVE